MLVAHVDEGCQVPLHWLVYLRTQWPKTAASNLHAAALAQAGHMLKLHCHPFLLHVHL